ncbi:peptidase S8 and S53 subtilisin kexin sedolisin [Parafrankia sp. EAN1pec]|uniref:S8 family serine peptidase n=1 Tax=Parafrankia sp. (strain EAN1pec) TaxID=298653 RepID=UPI00015D9CEF|nr:peptidase S8 and S53 subtilisin kexin sedolisin [Frankia sp. EAN1pec]
MGHRGAAGGARAGRHPSAGVTGGVLLAVLSAVLLPGAAAGTAAAATPQPAAPGASARPAPRTTPAPTASAPGRSPSGGLPSSGFSSADAQWYHESLRLAEAHRVSRGRGIIVAIIDGGVDATHPKLRGQLLSGAGVGADAALDGLRDDDPDGHGTAMAGLVAARGDVGDPAVWGVAPEAKILPISTGEEADSEEVARSVRIAVDRGAGVISMSLGSVGRATGAEESAVRYALANDVVVVASAGNTEPGDTEVNSPANIPGVIAVTGSDYRGMFWGGSVQGPEAVLAAPGPGIRAPVPTRVSPDGLDTGGGTSNSAAIVAGVAALVRAAKPGLDAPNVINRLIRTALDMGPVGRDSQYGFGLVEPVAALTAELPLVDANPLLTAPIPRTGSSADGGSGAGGGATPDGAIPALPTPPPPATAAPPVGAAGAGPDGGGDDPSVLTWVAGLSLAASAGVLLGALAYVLAGARFAATLGRRGRATAHLVTEQGAGPPATAPVPPGPPPGWTTQPGWAAGPTRAAPPDRTGQPVPPHPAGPAAGGPRTPGGGVPVDTRGWRTPH